MLNTILNFDQGEQKKKTLIFKYQVKKYEANIVKDIC